MPQFAHRMDAVKGSVIVQITNKAREMKAAGRNIISFSIGVPNFLPPKHVYDAAHKAVDNDAGAYMPCKGTDELITAFQGRLKLDGFDYNTDEICVTSGAKNALFDLSFCMINEGDEVILPTPYWSSYEDLCAMTGGKMVNIKASAEQNYKITAKQLEAAITPKTKLLVFNNPSNPTGMVYNKQEIKELADVLVKHDIWIISDDIYDKLIFDGEKFHSLLHARPELRDRTIILQSVSKTYGMPGWRVGMVAAPNAVIKKILTMTANTIMNIPPVSMAAAAAAFSGDHSFMDKTRPEFQKKRDIVMETMAKIKGIKCPKPAGAFYAFPDVSFCFGKSYNGEVIKNDVHLCEMLLEQKEIALVPGGAFGEPNAVRISYACKENDLREGLKRFEQFFNELN